MAPLTPELIERLKSKGGPWEIRMFDAPCKAPGKFCYACACPCCFLFTQRRELLEMSQEKYLCCAGLCPCGPLGKPQDEQCLYLEVCCCPGIAVGGNRWMLQTRYLRQNDPCDDCLIIFQQALQCLACILRAVGSEDADEVTILSDVVNCCVCSCALAQHQVEIEKLKEQKNTTSALQEMIELLPPAQQEMISIAQAKK